MLSPTLSERAALRRDRESATPGEPREEQAELRLPAADWRRRELAHQRRADELTSGHRARRQRGESHPVEDFLWTYYSVTPNELRRWHPGAGVVLEAGAKDREKLRYYVTRGENRRDAVVDIGAYFSKRRATIDHVERLLGATLERTPQFGCFGLHEWAMVYRLDSEQRRHTRLPLRLEPEATDHVVESHRIACTHFDAYRFFTPGAAPLNTLRPSRETQPELEQSGCLHAGMDVYKWAAKLGPVVPGELLLDAFVLARDIREVDMRASPYDVSGFTGANGRPLAPIAIEVAEGKREYAALQRGFADRGNALRVRVLAAIGRARAAHSSH